MNSFVLEILEILLTYPLPLVSVSVQLKLVQDMLTCSVIILPDTMDYLSNTGPSDF